MLYILPLTVHPVPSKSLLSYKQFPATFDKGVFKFLHYFFFSVKVSRVKNTQVRNVAVGYHSADDFSCLKSPSRNEL